MESAKNVEQHPPGLAALDKSLRKCCQKSSPTYKERSLTSWHKLLHISDLHVWNDEQYKEHKAPIWCQSTGARISLKSGSLMCCSLQISTFMWAQCMQRWIGKLECSFIIYSKLWGWAWPVLSKLNEFGTTSITISKEPVQHDLLGWQDLATPGPSLAPNHLSTSHHIAHLLLQFADLAIHCTLSFVRITAKDHGTI